jgi:hypothetical protein
MSVQLSGRVVDACSELLDIVLLGLTSTITTLFGVCVLFKVTRFIGLLKLKVNLVVFTSIAPDGGLTLLIA